MSAPYLARHPLRFHIYYRKNLLSDIAKRFFGQQNIEVGHADVDRDFVIQGSDVASIRKLMGSATLRSLLQAREALYLKSEGTALKFVRTGVIKDITLLNALHALFVETLNELQRLSYIR